MNVRQADVRHVLKKPQQNKKNEQFVNTYSQQQYQASSPAMKMLKRHL